MLRLAGSPVYLAGALLFVLGLVFYSSSPLSTAHSWSPPRISLGSWDSSVHPISKLIEAARRHHERASQGNSVKTVQEAARIYRARRGRHPPPHFDAWVQYALAKGSSLNEDYFDQIHDDIEPFWGMVPARLRFLSRTFDAAYIVRNGTVRLRHAMTNHFNAIWVNLWNPMMNELAPLLPDLDMPLNNVDEPRVAVPWEEIEQLVSRGNRLKHTRTGPSIHNDYTRYDDIPFPPPPEVYTWADEEPYWEIVRQACHPSTIARNWPYNETGLANAPLFDSMPKEPYVSNVTASRSACEHPLLSALHGGLIKPSTSSTCRKLFPMFSTSKMTGLHNDILIPSASYFETHPSISGGTDEERGIPWADKQNITFWRGPPIGGSSAAETWTHFHRNRLVAMTNGTLVAAEEEQATEGRLSIFPVPAPQEYPLAALETTPSSLAPWISKVTDVHFDSFACKLGHACLWMHPWYSTAPEVPLAEAFQRKYLLDVDGTAHSKVYRSILASTSVPLKATVYSEWHDSRLIPWHHFVPLENSFRDLYGVIEYFLGYDPQSVGGAVGGSARKPHDKEGEAIANQGREFAERHLRTEDMHVYVYRLLLEYARVMDERRVDLGFTGDL